MNVEFRVNVRQAIGTGIGNEGVRALVYGIPSIYNTWTVELDDGTVQTWDSGCGNKPFRFLDSSFSDWSWDDYKHMQSL